MTDQESRVLSVNTANGYNITALNEIIHFEILECVSKYEL